ncbi:hypothetical protein QR90_06850 [Deinococcus radiopugnans]|uniref:Uncharacterized protein n=1 Tax=Deinococcus radiopugnans TaxID=57497 RepID=A0A0A7KFI4_9DEIO|nr:hypothetical protein QR90_06850 [Deinococcus radiopugnans]
MAEGSTQGVVNLVITLLGGTTGLAALGVLFRGYMSGTITQEKEMREDLRTEVGRLRDVQDQQATEIRALRRDVQQLTTVNLHLITSRADARALVNALERDLGRASTVWPPDPTGGP